MRIDYCPKCGKAGLKYHNLQNKNPDGNTDQERFDKWNKGESLTIVGLNKWCPRCKEWVEPVNRPYVGVRGTP